MIIQNSRYGRFMLLIAVILSGCGAPEMIGTHIGGDLTPNDFGYPDRNPAAKRTVVISGSVSPSLKLELVAHYLTDGSVGCQSTSSFITGAVEGAKFPSVVSIPLNVGRSGDQYTAVAKVDEFSPGRCDWQFGYVMAIVSKGDQVSIPNLILRARDDWKNPRIETETENSRDTPILLHCAFPEQGGGSANIMINRCVTAGSIKRHDKREQFFAPRTTAMVANFIDDGAIGKVESK